MANLRFFADYDSYGHPELKEDSELLELVRLDAKHFQFLLGSKIGNAIIKRSVNGYHLVFPFAKLTREEVNWLMTIGHCDTGYHYWVDRKGGRATLRIGEKPILKMINGKIVGKKTVKSRPQVIEVIKLE